MRIRWVSSLVFVVGLASSASAAQLGAPTNLVASVASSTSVSLAWADNNGNPAEDGYSVERSTNGTTFAAVAMTGTNATTYVDGGLVTGTTYWYRVRAVRASQTSAYSNVASATPKDTTPPSAPNPLSDSVMSCSQIDLTWGASTDTGGSGLAGYKIYRNNAFVKQVGAASTTSSDTGLVQSTAYTYHVNAIDNAGNESSNSMLASGITPNCPTTTTTAAPTTTTTSSTSTSRPTTSSTSTSTTRPSTTSTLAATTSTLATTSSTSTSTTHPSTTSTIATTTTTSSSTSTSKPSTTSTIATTTSTTSTTLEKIPPSVPLGLVTTPVSCSQVNLSWIASTDTGGSGLAGYRVYRNNAFVQQVATTSTSDTGLAGATVYSYQVSAIDNAGNESARGTAVGTNTPACAAPSGGYVWAKQMGGTVLADSAVPGGVAVDASGNSYVVGNLYGTANFGTISLTSVGRSDLFIAKYSSAGVVQWALRFGDAADQFGNAIAVDGSGNVYVTGYYFGTVDFGGGPITSNSYDVFLAKYTTNGVHVWSKAIGGASTDEGNAIAVDSGGNVLVGGEFAATVDFGGGPLTSAGGFDGFLAKYTTNGAFVWAKRVGGATVDDVTGVGVDSSGNPTIVGYFQGTSNFGGADLTSAGGNDVFVAHYTSAGVHQWSTRFGDADDQRAYAVAVNGAGNIAITGYFAGSIGFGGPTLVNVGGADIFVTELNSAGGHVWSRAIGATGSYGEVGEGVAFDGSGNVLLTGEVIEACDFGGGLVIPSVVTYDAFVAKYSPTGAYLWAHRYVSNWDDHGDGIAVDGSGNAIAVGDFYDSEDFGGGLMTSPGGTDGFILKLTP